MASVEVRLSGTNLERAADHNQRTVLHAIRVHNAITRVALAQVTGLTAPAVANIVKRLIDSGLVIETGRLKQGRGQPGKVIQINPKARFSFGVNIDRDHLTMVLINFLGDIVSRRHWEANFLLPEDIKHYWQTASVEMLAEAGADPSLLSGIGVAIPSGIEDIIVPEAPQAYKQWHNVSVSTLFESPFAIPVIVENDATAAAAGEQQFGIGPQFSSMFYLLISAGLGGALVADGHVVRGANGRCGEIGLIPISGTKLLQEDVALTNLSRHLAVAGQNISDVLAQGDESTCDAATDGWIAEASSALVPALVSTICLFDPAIILIGSRLPAAIVERLAEVTSASINSQYPDLPALPVIKRAQLSGAASAIGAATLPFIRFYQPIGDALWKE